MSTLEQEYATYLREKPRLLAERKEGQWVLIKGDELIAVYGDETAAINEGYSRLGNVPFLVHQVRRKEPRYVMVPRLVQVEEADGPTAGPQPEETHDPYKPEEIDALERRISDFRSQGWDTPVVGRLLATVRELQDVHEDLVGDFAVQEVKLHRHEKWREREAAERERLEEEVEKLKRDANSHYQDKQASLAVLRHLLQEHNRDGKECDCSLCQEARAVQFCACPRCDETFTVLVEEEAEWRRLEREIARLREMLKQQEEDV